MPQIAKRRKLIKVGLPTKRIQYLGKYAKRRAFEPLYEKLKSNNKSLAKALSKQKQESRLLFSENVALTAEIQDLILACNKRNNAILKIQEVSEQTMKMLSTMSRSLANIISFCREFTSSSNMNLQVSYNSVESEDGGGREEEVRMVEENKEWSTKSPIKGIVKPMISGHTITKPTINLSRVNMHQINNPSNLSTIDESTNGSDRLGSGRTCRLPERLNILSPRNSEEDGRPLDRESSRYSSRMPMRLSKPKSSRLSDRSVKRRSVESSEQAASPRAKLNEVSKLLQSSPTVNVRRLSLMENSLERDRNSNTLTPSTTHGERSFDKIHLELQVSPIGSSDESTELIQQKGKKTGDVSIDARARNTSRTHSQDDPLEGPSWLFNESFRKRTITDEQMIPHKNTLCNSVQTAACYGTNANNYFRSNEERMESNNNNNNIPTRNISANTASFVTQRRGHVAKGIDDDFDVDDFTLMMYMRQPVHDVPFDVNELKLPVLEGSTINSNNNNESDPEVTTTLRQIVQSSSAIPSVYDELLRDRISSCFVKLPMLSNNTVDDTGESSSTHTQRIQRIESAESEKATMNSKNCCSRVPSHSPKKRGKRNSKFNANKDPSSAKVVLQKLNELSDLNDSKRSVDCSQADNSSDSENGGTCAPKRPRRQKAPINLREPNLHRKVRRT